MDSGVYALPVSRDREVAQMSITERIEAAKTAAAAFPERIRAIHGASCETWETWSVTERTITATGSRSVENTYVGCREHGVRVLVG